MKYSPLFSCIFFLLTAGAYAAETSVVEIIETKIISQQPWYYHGWPTVVRCANGDLRVVYSGGRDFHICPFGRLEMMTSRDDGANWTMPRVLLDSATDDRDAGIVETSEGTLLVTSFNSIAYQLHLNNPERLLQKTFGDGTLEVLKRWHLMDAATSQAQKQTDTGHWMLRSTDGGVSWSKRYRVPGYSPHGPINLIDGRLFYATSNGNHAAAHISEDDGQTWQEISKIDLRPGEMHAVQASNGDIVVQVRDKIVSATGSEQNTSQIVSADGGKSWSEKQKVADGYPSHLLRLHDGTLLMTYGWREEPYGVRGKYSQNHGTSWSDEFLIASDSASWDLGYPSSVQLQNGELLTVWYETPKDSHKAVLRQSRWRLNL
ncbi:MAG: exo-alpha-sialidase [Planctomycetales bacterium]|nr:exo-alpha-sialidase [Planctomycetales bacterium]